MDFSSYFPIWNKLTPTQQQILERNAVLRKVDKGTVIHNGTVECYRSSAGKKRTASCLYSFR
jgi:hypothetical protein